MSRSVCSLCGVVILLMGCGSANNDKDGTAPDVAETAPPKLDGKVVFPDTGPPKPDGPKPDAPKPDGATPDGPTPDMLPPADTTAWPLVVTCDGTPKSGQPPLPVTFSLTATGGPAGHTFAWDFGDGKTDNTKAPQHTYLIGKFSPVVTVTSGTETEICKVPLINAAIDQQVNVPAGGGEGKLTFDAVKGQKLLITLTGTPPMVPFGFIEAPDNSGEYVPLESTASGGKNIGQTTLTQSGTFEFKIFESTNIGGNVQVQIEEI